MKILGIETATPVLGVALLDGAHVRLEITHNLGKTHGERLAPLIEQALREAGWRARDLDAVAVSSGPGSFTGLRIGLSTAKGLAFAAGCPLVGVPTLEALAANVAGLVSPMIDARRGEVYAGLYRTGQDGTPEAVLPPQAGPLTEWMERVAEAAAGATVAYTGDVAVHQAVLQARNDVVLAPPHLRHARAASVAALAAQRLKAARQRGADLRALFDPVALEAVYLRPSLAELQWEQAHGSGNHH